MENSRLRWIDQVKAIAFVWIFLNHASERFFGYPYFSNPALNWPSFGGRINQLKPIECPEGFDILINTFRYIGWSGDQGVQLFLIVSGFSLTWGLCNRQVGSVLQLVDFYKNRFSRIYPLWWGTHLALLPIGIFTSQMSPLDATFYFSMLGVRITPHQLYYFSPAWWFFGLLLQLYLVYPLIWRLIHRFGPRNVFFWGCVFSFAIRGIGLFFFTDYLDAWNRGSVFISRLPEFLFGICLAWWFAKDRKKTELFLESPVTLAYSLVIYFSGIALALTLPGMIFAPFLLGISAFLLIFRCLPFISCLGRNIDWIGKQSYSLYLVHHPIILFLIPSKTHVDLFEILGYTFATFIITIISAISLVKLINFTSSNIKKLQRKNGNKRFLVSTAIIAVFMFAVLLCCELFTRFMSPQEILGWGERPALKIDSKIGWRLLPSKTTRLRWESYDYSVTANSLGFPGPEYAKEKPSDTLRIMVVGDAFTSAEGVNTDQAWPRVLESRLSQVLQNQTIEVMNFAITGYGPDQYTAVTKYFAPVYRPDILIIGFFVNEYQDVLISNSHFQQEIGFGNKDSNSPSSIIGLRNLRRIVRLRIIEPIKALIQGAPSPPHGYFLGNFLALERGQRNFKRGKKEVAERMAQMRKICQDLDVKVFLLMIPAPVQVCNPDQLKYYPQNVDLSDTNKFDFTLPQRTTAEIALHNKFIYYDLLPVLKEEPECVYQPQNMHWKKEGHQKVAKYLEKRLIMDGGIYHP